MKVRATAVTQPTTRPATAPLESRRVWTAGAAMKGPGEGAFALPAGPPNKVWVANGSNSGDRRAPAEAPQVSLGMPLTLGGALLHLEQPMQQPSSVT